MEERYKVGDRVAKHEIGPSGEFYRVGTVANVFVDHNGQEHADVILETSEFPHQSFLTSTLCYESELPPQAKRM